LHRQLLTSVVAAVLALGIASGLAAPAEAIVKGIVVPGGWRDDRYPENNPYGFVGLVVMKDGSGCTASLVAPDLALTASHCSGIDHITFGMLNRDRDKGVKRSVIEEKAQSDADPILKYGATLLVRLDHPIYDIAPVRMADPSDSALWEHGARSTLLGWGQINSTGTWTRELRSAVLKMEDSAISNPLGRGYMKLSSVTGWGTHGDSGGPLVGIDARGKLVQLGIFEGSRSKDSQYFNRLWPQKTLRNFVEANQSVPTPRPGDPTPSPTPLPINKPPVAAFSYQRLTGAGNRVRFDGRSSSDPDGTVTSWQWMAAGSVLATGPTPTVSFGAAVRPTVTLVVSGTSVSLDSGWVGQSWRVPPHRLDPGGRYTWKVTVRDASGSTASRSSSFTVAMLPTAADTVPTSSGKGYWQVASDGGVFSYGDAGFHGSLPGLGIHQTNIMGMARTPDDGGYWLVGTDGGVFSFGNARFYGSLPGINVHVNNIVGMAATKTGHGYWLVGSDGGVFAFGDARFYGSMGGKPLNKPVTSLSPTRTGNGYWLAAQDGGIFSFGDAPFYGSLGSNPLNAPVVDMDASPDGGGYWMTAEDGGVFAFGNAKFYGSMANQPLNGHITGMAVTATGRGYWLNGCDGGVFAFGDAPFLGSNPTYQCRGTL
jgi:hypothetical protein